MNKSVKERIRQLRKLMEEQGMDAYLVPTSDYHETEYVGAHFTCREYITGFTGSAGTALITRDWAGLWTDGRYFVQAAAQLAGSGVELMKAGQPGVPTLIEYLAEHLPEDGVLGFDGRVINAQMAAEMDHTLCTADLIGKIWAGRPAVSAEPIWVLAEKYAGKSAAEKIADVRREMKKHHATVHILTTLDDIAWLLNIRGNDIPCNPVVMSYLVMTGEQVILYANPVVAGKQEKAYLDSLGVTIRPYEEIYSDVGDLHGESVLLERSHVNYAIARSIDSSNQIIDRMNPTVLAKARKNPVEIENLKQAHVKDGVAMTKYIYWLKHNIGKIPMTETSVSDYLEALRQDQGCLGSSFTTISAYGANAAMCHYHADRERCAVLEPKGLYLVDSGGQYLAGTTDITRTMALGPVTAEEKEHYTLVLMSMLRLANVKFLAGCSGLSLDYVARELMWQRGLDYNHGTGHGIGYLLNVHERPVGIRYRVTPERQEGYPFEPGMVCSDEPGLYIEGSHGIRTENLIFCQEDEKTPYGQFLKFAYLTFVPIDLEPVDVSLMEDRDIAYLNEYHARVYEQIAPHLTVDEAAWLKAVTAPVGR